MSLRNILFRGSYKMLKPRLQPDTTPCLDSCNRSEECRSAPVGNGGRSILCICCLLKVSRRDVTHIQSWNAFFVCVVCPVFVFVSVHRCVFRGEIQCVRGTWAFATLKHREPEWLRAVVRARCEFADFSPQNMSNFVAQRVSAVGRWMFVWWMVDLRFVGNPGSNGKPALKCCPGLTKRVPEDPAASIAARPPKWPCPFPQHGFDCWCSA